MERPPPELPRFPPARKPTDVIFPTWGGYGADCPDCGFTFVEPTPERAREAVTNRDLTHHPAYCAKRAASLSKEEKARLARLYGTQEHPAAKKAVAKKPAKPVQVETGTKVVPKVRR